MFARSQLVALSALVLGVACSTEEASTSNPRPKLDVATTEFTVPAGAEVFMCTVTDVVLPEPFDVVEVHHQQMAGGHHVVLLYTTDDLQPGPTHECTDAEMTKVRFVGGGDEGAEQRLALPPGMAIKMPKGVRVVLQSHYVNPTGTPKTVKDTLSAYGPADPRSITKYADAMTVLDSDFRIPAHGEQTRIVDCPIDEDLDVLNLFGHAHEWSTNVKIGIVRNGATAVEPLYNEKGGKELMFNAPTIDFTSNGTGLHLAKGDKIRLECSWRNSTDKILEFPSEMCVAQMYYAPGRGPLVCGKAIVTRGDVVPAAGETGMSGCTAPPASGEACVRPCDQGNSRGVGKYCTKGGHQCDDNQSAIFCTADTDPTAPGFCTKPCSDASACGLEAVCTGDDRGKGCVPVLCAGT